MLCRQWFVFKYKLNLATTSKRHHFVYLLVIFPLKFLVFEEIYFVTEHIPFVTCKIFHFYLGRRKKNNLKWCRCNRIKSTIKNNTIWHTTTRNLKWSNDSRTMMKLLGESVCHFFVLNKLFVVGLAKLIYLKNFGYIKAIRLDNGSISSSEC